MKIHLEKFKDLKYSEHKDIIDSSFVKYNNINLFNKIKFKLLAKVYNYNEKWIYKKAKENILNQYNECYIIQEKCREGDGLSGDFQWVRLNEIVEIMNTFSPDTVCEFGSGGSSAMFAYLLKDKNKFTTVEENEYWQKKMIKSVGSISKYINSLLASRVLIKDKDGESVVHYNMKHDRYYDLVYVDGPSNQKLKNDPEDLKTFDTHGRLMPNIDVEIMWENKIYPKVIVIDGRRSTLRRLMQKNPGFYKVYPKSTYTFYQKIFIRPYFLFHSILVRMN